MTEHDKQSMAEIGIVFAVPRLPPTRKDLVIRRGKGLRRHWSVPADMAGATYSVLLRSATGVPHALPLRVLRVPGEDAIRLCMAAADTLQVPVPVAAVASGGTYDWGTYRIKGRRGDAVRCIYAGRVLLRMPRPADGRSAR